MQSLRSCFAASFCALLLCALCFSVGLAQPSRSTGFTIQIASVTAAAEAQHLIAELKAKGIDAYWTRAEIPGKGTRYRVRTGRFKTLAAAKATAEVMRAQGQIAEFIATTYDALPVEPASNAIAQTTVAQEPVVSQVPARKQSPTALPAVTPPAKSLAGPDARIAQNALTAAAPASTKSDEEPPAHPPVQRSETANAAPTPPARDEATERLIATPGMADALADLAINNEHWKLVRRSAETDKHLRAVFFVDTMTGWVAGDAGAVQKTTDGGRTWKPLLIGAAINIESIFFADWNHGWMLGESGAEEGETILLATTNGGRTWTRRPLPGVLGLHFIDALNGWAVGRNALLMKTTDGGATWQKLDVMEKLVGLPVESSNYNYGFRDIQFIDAQHGWLIGNFYGRAQSNIGGIFATSDGGATWKRLPITIQTQYASGRFTPGLFHSVKFTDQETGSVTGEMRDGESRYFFSLHTRDGGRTWEQFRTPSRATHSTQYLDLFHGWTAAFAPREGGAEAKVYDTTLMRTDNGGMSWRNDFVAKGRRIRGVFFLSPGKGWAVGDRGLILRYEDKSKVNLAGN